MIKSINDISLSRAALVAGIGLLLMTTIFILADIFAFRSLIVPGDAAATANNIMAEEILFRIAICSFIIVAILDLVVAWAIYILLKPVNKSLSLLAAWFRLVYAAILVIALLNLVIVLLLLSGANYLVVFDTEQLHAQVLLFLNAFDELWAIGLILFGFHLIILGYLVFKSGYISRIMGILLIAAGLGYPVSNFAKLFFPNFDASLIMFLGWGELLFMFWLLFKGAKIPEIKKVQN